MKKITSSNKHIALDIAQNAFMNNPSMSWFLKSGDHAGERMRALCDYCISTSMMKEGAFLTDDMNGIVLMYRNHAAIRFFQHLKLIFNLVTKCTGWFKLLAMIYRQIMVQRVRGEANYLYVLLIASNHRNGIQTAIEIKDFIFHKSREFQLPVYAETCSKGNKLIYERYGFSMYDYCLLPGTSTTLWFMRREVSAFVSLPNAPNMNLAI